MLFNIAVVRGVAHAEPAVIAVAVACAPVFLGVVGPMRNVTARPGRWWPPRSSSPPAACWWRAPARPTAPGVGWAAVALACECGFTLLALPVLGRHGPYGVSLHSVWLGAAMFAVLGLVGGGPGRGAGR